MGRGGGGGADRSFGGGSVGGSRSSGGRRGGGSSSRGGFNGGASSHRFDYPHHTARHYHGSIRRSSSPASTFASFIFILLLVLFYAVFSLAGKGDITKSTIDREPLPVGAVVETAYYEDTIGWIESRAELENGMKSFYKKTGVQPFLYLTETVNGNWNPTDAEMAEFANELYDRLFEDEAHLLLVFQEYNSSGQYFSYYIAGKQAKTVIDQEAADILLDYIDSYYYSDMTESEFFGEAFRDAGSRIMNKTMNPLVVIVLIIGAVVALVIMFLIIRAIIRHKERETAATERILNTDLDDIASDPTLQDLEDRYR